MSLANIQQGKADPYMALWKTGNRQNYDMAGGVCSQIRDCRRIAVLWRPLRGLVGEGVSPFTPRPDGRGYIMAPFGLKKTSGDVQPKIC